MHRALAAAILTAASTVFPRIAVIGTLIEPALGARMAPPLVLMAMRPATGLALWQMEVLDHPCGGRSVDAAGQPFTICKTALQFGALLALIVLCARAPQGVVGARGVAAIWAANGMPSPCPRRS